MRLVYDLKKKKNENYVYIYKTAVTRYSVCSKVIIFLRGPRGREAGRRRRIMDRGAAIIIGAHLSNGRTICI